MTPTDKREDAGGDAKPFSDTRPERRQSGRGLVARRMAVQRAIARQRLDDFQETLGALAIAVFGQQATVVAHLRTSAGREWLTFVVDAADPASVLQYEEFLPRERAFWTAYSQLTKPSGSQFVVAIRPARGWCRVEALAPLFSMIKPPDLLT